MSNIDFRPFDYSDQDYHTIIAIWNAVWPGNETSLTEFKHSDDTRDKSKLFERLVGLIDGRPAGYGVYSEAWWYDKPGRYYLTFHTHPDCRRRGLASVYYDRVIDILQGQEPFTSIEAQTREDKPESIRFLEKRGFKQVMRYQRSELNVQQFDPTPFSSKVKAVKAKGIELVSLAELMDQDEDWMRKLYDMDVEIIKDIPAPDPIKPMPFEQYQKRIMSPSFFPQAFAVAVDNGRYVGTSGLWLSEANPEKLYTGLTGVLRSHRRLGLATALKTKTISYAKELGYKTIETDNEENNPMYQINVQLGFIAQPAELEFHKIITAEDE